ncbi:MAG: hypothetical protein KKC66_06175 [Candidatus Omnitrophica bacterium]|nr:hypothetical protein [Candidatus Omnitrophota bacterium]MBU1933468.1 hypothetical protein [Candidatus Omnitrophota bacterium]
MGKYITVLGGLICIIIGIWGILAWKWNFIALLKGCLPPILALGGLAAFFAGISEIKDANQAKKEEVKEKK